MKQYIADLFRNVPVLDTGARGSTTTFAQRGIGDVFISWENEAFLVQKEFGADNFDIVVPSLSIKAEPPVAVVEGDGQGQGQRGSGQGLSRVPLLARRPEARRQALLPPGRSKPRPTRPTLPAFPSWNW